MPLLLAAVTALIWCAHYDRFTLTSWSEPINYVGDSMEVLVRIKAVSDGELVPFSPQTLSRLGAPFGADWSAYPVSDKLMFFFYGNLARVIGVFPASNLAVMFAFVTAALSFYGCARFLRVRREWCFAGALLFAFTTHTLMRGLPHLTLAYTYTVPCALLVCWLVGAARHLRWPSAPFVFCLCTAAVMGVSNPYNLFFFLQLLCLALLAQLLGERRRENLWLGGICLVAALGAWALLQCDNWLYVGHEGASDLIARNYGGTELYALKPVELLVPPQNHHLAVWASVAHRYIRWTAQRGEPFFPYLGMVVIAGLVWVMLELLQRILRRDRNRVPAHGLQIVWILLFSAVGGINSIISLWFGLHLFRATNRFSIFISAIVGLFLISRLSRLTRSWPRMAGCSCATVLVVVGLYDQIPRGLEATDLERSRQVLQSDQQLGAQLEARLPRNGMIFQLPVVDFPETRPPNQLPDYDPFRLYLVTHTQRLSYGVLKSGSIAQWQRDFEALAPADLVQALEQAGFSAICIDRRGYTDNGEALSTALRSTGRQVLWDRPGTDYVVFQLQPQSRSRAPLATHLTFGQGWSNAPGETQLRWSNGPAVLSYYNPYRQPIRASLHLSVSRDVPAQFRVAVNGQERLSLPVKAQLNPVVIEKLELKPGVNRIDLSSSSGPLRVSEERWGLHDFAIGDLDLLIAVDSLPAALPIQSTSPVRP